MNFMFQGGGKFPIVVLASLFYFFNVKFTFIPVSSFVWSNIFLVWLSIVFVMLKGSVRFGGDVIAYGVLYFLFFLSITLSFFLKCDDNNFDVLRLVPVVFISAFIFPYLFFRVLNNDVLVVFKALGYVGLVNAFFIVGMFLLPSFKSFWHVLVDTSVERFYGEIDMMTNLMSLRMVGITGFSAYSTSIVQVFMSVFYMLYVKYSRKEPRFLDYIFISLIFISAFISGRTAFVVIPLALLFFLYLFGFLKVLKYFCCFVLILPIFFYIFSFSVNNFFYEFFYSWIVSVFEKGSNVGSLRANVQMLHQYSFNDFSLLGDLKLRSIDGGYYKDVDVGYYRMLFAFGWIGFFTFSVFVVSPLFFILKDGCFNNPEIVVAMLLLGVLVLLVLFKGAILFDAYPIISMFFVLGGAYRRLNCRRLNGA